MLGILGAVMTLGAINALIPIVLIIILIAAAAGAMRNYDIFTVFGFATLLGVGGGGRKGTMTGKSGFSKGTLKRAMPSSVTRSISKASPKGSSVPKTLPKKTHTTFIKQAIKEPIIYKNLKDIKNVSKNISDKVNKTKEAARWTRRLAGAAIGGIALSVFNTRNGRRYIKSKMKEELYKQKAEAAKTRTERDQYLFNMGEAHDKAEEYSSYLSKRQRTLNEKIGENISSGRRRRI